MSLPIKRAMAIVALAIIALPAMARADGPGTSLPPGSSPDTVVAQSDQGPAQADNSKPFPENFIPITKPIHKLWCFDGALIGRPGTFYYENMGDLLKKGSQVEITFQPGNKKLLLTVPTDLKLWVAIHIPFDMNEVSHGMTCSAVVVFIP